MNRLNLCLCFLLGSLLMGNDAEKIMSAAGNIAINNVENLKVPTNSLNPPGFTGTDHKYYSVQFRGAKLYWEFFDSQSAELDQWENECIFPIPFVLYDWNYVKINSSDPNILIFKEKIATNADSNTSNFVVRVRTPNGVVIASIYFLDKSIEPAVFIMDFIKLIDISKYTNTAYSSAQYPIQKKTPRKMSNVAKYIDSTIDSKFKMVLKAKKRPSNKHCKDDLNLVILNYVDFLVRELALNLDNSPLGAEMRRQGVLDPYQRSWRLIDIWKTKP